jgi:precorrin-2 dehydrogenase/sirohydrochlorin ferrochelatase
MQPSLQVGLRVAGRQCVVVGGGPQAEERVVRLLEAQARPVIVVAEAVTSALERWSEAGRIERRGRPFEPADLDGTFVLLLCDTTERAQAERLYCLAQARGVLMYAQDLQEFSDMTMPALVRRGGVRLAISTSEASPALAGRLRAELERLLDEPFLHYVAWLDALRERVRLEEPDADRRAARLRAAVDGFGIDATLRYPDAYRPFMPQPRGEEPD